MAAPKAGGPKMSGVGPAKVAAGVRYGYDAKTAGQKVGLEVWRIEKLDVVLQASFNNCFFSGDCYIVLKTNETKGARDWQLHYWLGNGCSADEQGAVAFKAVELDDLLGGRPVQHREVQGHESPLFMSYFPGGLRYLEGGIATAFNHVDPSAYVPRLLHLKGKRTVRVNQVDCKTSSLNEGDVFILDCGLNLFQWNGRGANKYEKFKGLEMVTAIKDKERGGKAKVVFLESGTPNPDDALFWKTLGGKDGIQDEKAGGSDDEVKAHVNELFRISDASGSIEVTSVARGRLEKKMLDPADVFLLDVGSQVFVWIGKDATKEERNKGMIHGANYLSSQGRPAHTPLTRVVGTGETPLFKSYFVDFADPRPTGPAPAKTVAKKAADTSALYSSGGAGAGEEKMPDKGDGKVEIWRIEGFAKVAVEPANYGQFFAGDSYIILYTYAIAGKPAWIIYFWQGRDSSLDEKASSALLAADLDRELGGSPVQVRVVQNKEPNHFLTLFKGKMIVHEGGKASGFKNRADVDSYDTDGISLYHIKGTNELNTRAVQVPERATSLNSGDCFALLTPSVVYVWQGKGANPTERKTAAGTAAVIKGSRTVTLVEEGKEPEAFWTAVGGKAEYAGARADAEPAREARLFHCSSNGGSFHVEEVFGFSQDDLVDDDVMILDTYSEVFVWVGGKSSREEKDSSLTAALDFVTKAPDGRSADTPIYKVHPGGEPPNFTCHFLGWNPARVIAEDPYADAVLKLKSGAAGAAPAKGAGAAPKAEVKAAAPGAAPKVEAVTRESVGFLDWKRNSFTLEQIKAGVTNMDPANKPLYLADSAFTALFKMSKDDFIKLAKWKADGEKKKHGLF